MRLRKERETIRKVLKKLPEALKDDPDVAKLRALAAERAVNVVHLIYRAHGWEGGARDFEFSRGSMEHHRAEGCAAIAETLNKGALPTRHTTAAKTAASALAKSTGPPCSSQATPTTSPA